MNDIIRFVRRRPFDVHCIL